MTQSGRIPDTHAEAWVLLPFLVNGRISAEDREWVELHVQSCADCRREFEAQRPLAQEMRHSEPPFASSEQRAFSKLWSRIEAAEAAIPLDQEPVVRSTTMTPRRNVRWLAAAVIVQAIGLALLGITAVNTSEESAGEFRTVTSVDVGQRGPAVRLVFSSDASIAEVTQILGRHHLELVGGPRGAGVFTAALDGERGVATADAVAAELRRNPHVQFAEPVAQ